MHKKMKLKLSNDKLVLKVYTPSNKSAMRQDEAPVDIHGWYGIILIFFLKRELQFIKFNGFNIFIIPYSNAPATRRQKIFESLSNSNTQVKFNEVKSKLYFGIFIVYTLRHLRNYIFQIECRDDNLDLALVAHDKGFINFLDTSWSRWEAMENHCVHFFG